MLRLKYQDTALLFVALSALVFTFQPSLSVAETAGSYAHPAIGGPDEGNPMGKPLMGLKGEEGSTSKTPPTTRTEGSTKKGYGPGAHPHKGKEGSGSKGYAHGGSYGHGKSGAHKPGHGGSHGYAKGHAGHGSGAGHGHGGYGGHHGSKGHKTNPFKHILKFKEKLGLSEDQVKRIEQMQFDWEKQRIKLGADHMIAHMELDRLVHSGTVDVPRMQELAKMIAHIKGQEIQAMVDAKIGLLKTLTDEQRKKVAAIHSNH